MMYQGYIFWIEQLIAAGSAARVGCIGGGG